jgi:peptidoglycan hydrolase FlgJ
MITGLVMEGSTRKAQISSSNHALVDAAQQFEAMLLQEMLKPMRAGLNGWNSSTEDSDREDTLSSYGTEVVARSISKSGGLGIARRVVQDVARESS